jgi:hypothetical protein
LEDVKMSYRKLKTLGPFGSNLDNSMAYTGTIVVKAFDSSSSPTSSVGVKIKIRPVPKGREGGDLFRSRPHQVGVS